MRLLPIAMCCVSFLFSEGQIYGNELSSGPYLLDLGATHVTVCWQTQKSVGGVVLLRAKGDDAWKRVEGSSTKFHAVPISDLQAASEYDVSIRDGGVDLTTLKLRTAPVKSDSFTFYVYGDTRSQPLRHKMVADAIAEDAKALKQSTFVIQIGDFARYGSSKKRTAEQFFEPANSMLRTLSLIPVKGNHEEGTGLYERYFPVSQRDGVSTEEGDYFQDYGSVRVVVLNQSESSWKNAERLIWLNNTLSDASNKWRIVVFHAPIYSSGSHGSDISFRKLIEPVLVAGKVHVVFSAHDHNYERIKPRKGITYFVSGGGGAPLRPLRGGAEAFSAKFVAVHHYISVTVTPKKLIIKAHSPDGDNVRFKVFDKVDISKKGDW